MAAAMMPGERGARRLALRPRSPGAASLQPSALAVRIALFAVRIALSPAAVPSPAAGEPARAPASQANDHMEARFLWCEADNAPFLTDRFNIYMLPTIVCIEDNKVKCQHNGLNDLDGSGKYTTGMLEYLLNAADGMLDDAPIYEQELREQEEAEFDDDDD